MDADEFRKAAHAAIEESMLCSLVHFSRLLFRSAVSDGVSIAYT